jgi:hypothetical protein
MFKLMVNEKRDMERIRKKEDVKCYRLRVGEGGEKK